MIPRLTRAATARALALATLVLLGAHAATPAQPNPHGYIVGTWNTASSVGVETLFILDLQGPTGTSISTGAASCYGVSMDRDNELVLATNEEGRILRVDPTTTTIVGTLVDLPGTRFRDITVGADGHYYATTTSPFDAVCRVTASGVVSTIAVLDDDPAGGLIVDVDTGHLLVLSRARQDVLRRVRLDGRAVTTVATGVDGRHGIAKHIPTGDLFSGSCCGDVAGQASLYVVKAGTSVSTAYAAYERPRGVYCVAADRASAATQELVVGAYGTNVPTGGRGVWRVDLATRLATPANRLIYHHIYDLKFLYDRNVHSFARGSAVWDIGVRIPEDAGRNFALVIGTSGVRPGVPLATGRTIPLLPDGVTVAGLAGLLQPILSRTVGTLDGNGEATSRLDVSGLPPTAMPRRVWLVCITLDAASPDGFKTITDPHVIPLD